MKTKRRFQLTHRSLIRVLLGLAVVQVRSQTLVNGGFELGTDPNTGAGQNIGLFAPDSATIPGWTVSAGTVDYIGSRWPAGEGVRSLDLSGISAGTVLQSVDGFTPGLAYELHFLMASNPDGGSPTKVLEAAVGGVSGTFSHTHTPGSSDMEWTLHTLGFIATGPTLTVSFTSLNQDASGPALDGITIAAVPEPSMVALSLVAVAALAISKGTGPLRIQKRP